MPILFCPFFFAMNYNSPRNGCCTSDLTLEFSYQFHESIPTDKNSRAKCVTTSAQSHPRNANIPWICRIPRQHESRAELIPCHNCKQSYSSRTWGASLHSSNSTNLSIIKTRPPWSVMPSNGSTQSNLSVHENTHLFLLFDWYNPIS